MATCEFEEREFETALYPQLLTQRNNLWAPGQVLEASLGFDYSAFCIDPQFWVLFGYSSPLSGIFLNGFHQSAYGHITRPLPNFSLNLFIQAKRPTYLTKLSKALKTFPISSPHWKFTIDATQQSRLEHLESITGGNALVCYAAPAFHRVLQLYSHTTSSSVVANSTFPEASILTGHHAWNYNKPGAVGVANSEPEFHEGISLEMQIERLIALGGESFNKSAESALSELAHAVIESVNGDKLSEHSTAALFKVRVNQLDSHFSNLQPNEASRAFRDYLVVHLYTRTYNMLWLTIGG
jgi:hypothetical protein